MDNDFTRQTQDGDSHVENDTPRPATPAPLAGFRAVRPPPPVAPFSVFMGSRDRQMPTNFGASRGVLPVEANLIAPLPAPVVPPVVVNEIFATGSPRIPNE